MKQLQSLVALIAALGGPAAFADPDPAADVDLRAARTRAGVALRAARIEFGHGDPDRALHAIRRAWDELSRVPGGQAFQDLVVLDATAELAKESLVHHDTATASTAVSVALQRIHG